MEKRMRDTRTQCGQHYMDVKIYPVWGTGLTGAASGKRRPRRKPTSEIQAKLNHDHATDHIRQLINTNFGPRDVHVTLTYKNDPGDEEADAELQRFLRRLKYHCRKAEKPAPKYLWVTERGKKKGRVHHHLILEGLLPRDTVEGLWQNGYADADRLQPNELGFAGIAGYISKDAVTDHRWGHSRGLENPTVKSRDFSVQDRDIKALVQFPEDQSVIDRLYPGWKLAEGVSVENIVNQSDYITIRLYRDLDFWPTKTRRRKKRRDRLDQRSKKQT